MACEALPVEAETAQARKGPGGGGEGIGVVPAQVLPQMAERELLVRAELECRRGHCDRNARRGRSGHGPYATSQRTSNRLPRPAASIVEAKSPNPSTDRIAASS